MRIRAFILGLSLVGIVGAGTSAQAAPKPAEQHCVVEVTGTSPNGELVTSSPRCFGDRAQARSAAGIASTIAVHFDGAGYTGSSITISGSDCLGGWLNLSLWWRNRISSSINYCPVVRFYDGLNLTGSVESMFSSGNLGAMNNRSESVQYSS